MGRRAVFASILVMLFLLAPSAAACISPYGFEDFEPTPLTTDGPTGDMTPVDVSASTVDDMFPKLVSYAGDLYSFWIKSSGVTFVSENLMTRVLRDGSWGPLLVVNNPDPRGGNIDGEAVRIGGFDVTVSGDLLYVVWCTPDPQLTHGPDSDPVMRTFDGTVWSSITEIVPNDDGGEDVHPSLAPVDGGILVAWTSTSPRWSSGTDQDIVMRHVGPDGMGPIVGLSPVDDEDNDFLPRVAWSPTGTHVVWHKRSLYDDPRAQGPVYSLGIYGRVDRGNGWSDIIDISDNIGSEDVWANMLWDGEVMALVWQRGGTSFGYQSTSIMYREWAVDGMGPVRQLSLAGGRVNEGRPKLALVNDEVRVYWHTNDDGFTVGSTFDLVWREREGEGYWGPLEVFFADRDRDLLQVDVVSHRGGTYASWMMNMTYDTLTPEGIVRVWDVVVGPVRLPPDPTGDITITPRWVRSTEAWGHDDRIMFVATRGGRPVEGSLLSVMVVDPAGDVEVMLSGTTDDAGQVTFDHVLRSFGEYTFDVVFEGQEMGALAFRVSAPPPGYTDILVDTLAIVAFFVAVLVLAGLVFIRRRGTVDPKREGLEEQVHRRTPWIWKQASRVLTKVVRSKRAQGYLQIPLFALFILSIVLGYLGTQDPQANFTTMLGWVYYLPGMLILYAFFGRLWCYVEACGFVDTWAKKLSRRRVWREWPEWMQNLWPAFLLLLAGFWVEIVFSIDLYPWAVATFMLVILLVNVAVSANFGKRTYCRFVCRDGVVEELIARFSIFKIGVQTRADSVNRGATCIWKEGEKRPGYCSMCFSCLQDNPDVKEATVTPMVGDFAKDVYRPRAVHRDEAMAALLLMGISIPYMAVLTRAWWVGLNDIAITWALPGGSVLLVLLGLAIVAATVAFDRWAFRRWAGTLTPIRQVLVVFLEALLLGQWFLAVLGGEVGRLIALRSLIVLGCISLPFVIVWAGERLVVRLTANSRQETAGRLMERYGLIFIPLFIGVLIARNMPIVGTWGWAAWDIIKATMTNFPSGAADVTPQPFVDPSLHFALGVAALAFGIALGAYTAFQISRRLYEDRSHAMRAFTVHSAVLGLLGGLFVLLLAMPPY